MVVASIAGEGEEECYVSWLEFSFELANLQFV
jgi:hypothetical protein